MINVRLMQQSDVEAVSRIEQECFSRPWSKQAFADTLQQPEALFLVAQDEEDVVGYCGMYVTFDEGEITNVAVASCARRKHVGGLLLQQLFEQAKTRGVARIVLEVRCSNTPAICLYEKMGFVTLGMRRNFYDLPREDARIMQKMLEES